MTVLLCDIGGTHIRFALGGCEQLSAYKTRVDQHRDLNEAITSYLSSKSVSADDVKAFYFAFSNRNEWNTNPDELRLALPKAAIRQVNDFEANAHGVIVADESDFSLLNKPVGVAVENPSRVVIGVGTGLGFAYICGQKGQEFVQRTHGAHMLPVYSKEHAELYEFIEKDKKDVLIYEDMLTGRGLYEIYKYLSKRNHLDIEYPDAEILMRDGKDNPVFQQSLTVFYQMLGLFTHQAVAFGYSYGGIYLTGGVIDRLMIAGLFDSKTFMDNFIQKNVPIVVRDVMSTPIYWIKDEFVSLKGLQYLAKEDGYA